MPLIFLLCALAVAALSVSLCRAAKHGDEQLMDDYGLADE